MTAVDVKIAVEAHVINMQDAKFSQDAHFYAAQKEKKVDEEDADVTPKVGWLCIVFLESVWLRWDVLGSGIVGRGFDVRYVGGGWL
jgi:hypothetical protein